MSLRQPNSLVQCEIAVGRRQQHRYLPLLLSRDNRSIVEPTGDETGRWRVFTSDSSYVLDFDAGTVQRFSSEFALLPSADAPQSLHAMERCRLSQPGAWTLVADDGLLTPVDGELVHRIEPEFTA